jgi:hypothetical protein
MGDRRTACTTHLDGLAVASVGLLLRQAAGIGRKRIHLKYGILSGLTGDPAVSGQAWNQAAKVGIGHQ